MTNRLLFNIFFILGQTSYKALVPKGRVEDMWDSVEDSKSQGRMFKAHSLKDFPVISPDARSPTETEPEQVEALPSSILQ